MAASSPVIAEAAVLFSHSQGIRRGDRSRSDRKSRRKLDRRPRLRPHVRMMRYVFSAGSEFDPLTEYVQGVNVHDQVTKRIVRPLRRVADLSNVAPGVGQALQFVNAGAAIANLGVSVASFAYMRGQFEAVTETLAGLSEGMSALASKIDRRHESDVFAEVGAALDALTLADDLAPDEARSLVLSNYVPLMKALRRLRGYVDECRADSDAGAPEAIALLPMASFATRLEVRALLLLARGEQASERAREHHLATREAVRLFTEAWKTCLLLSPDMLGDQQQVIDALVRLTGETGSALQSNAIWAMNYGVIGETPIPPMFMMRAFEAISTAGGSDRFVDKTSAAFLEMARGAADKVRPAHQALRILDRELPHALGLVLETELSAAGSPISAMIDDGGSEPIQPYYIMDLPDELDLEPVVRRAQG